jgi:outer membrane protein TolC
MLRRIFMRRLSGFAGKIFVLAIAVAIAAHPAEAADAALSVDDCIAIALKRHPDIKIAMLAKEKTAWAIREVEADKGFSLNLSHTATRSGSAISSSNSYRNQFANDLALTIPLYSGGKLESTIDKAKIDHKVAELNLEAAGQQLKQDVTLYYFNVLQYLHEVRINQETVENYAAHLQLVEEKYRIGLVAKTDALSSAVSLAQAQNDLIKAENNYNLALAKLNNALGLPLGTQLSLQDNLQVEKSGIVLADYETMAVARRPELAEYQLKIASAKEDVKIANSAYLPTANFSVLQNWYDKDAPGLSNRNWQAYITLTFNLFDSGSTESKRQQAEYSLATAAEQADQEKDSILLEVRQYHLSMLEAEKRIETNKVSVNQAQENLMIADARYNVGVGTNLDLLDAVLKLNQAKLDEIQARYDYHTSKAQLDKAIGAPVKYVESRS